MLPVEVLDWVFPPYIMVIAVVAAISINTMNTVTTTPIVITTASPAAIRAYWMKGDRRGQFASSSGGGFRDFESTRAAICDVYRGQSSSLVRL
jgi:hypothetical protein